MAAFVLNGVYIGVKTGTILVQGELALAVFFFFFPFPFFSPLSSSSRCVETNGDHKAEAAWVGYGQHDSALFLFFFPSPSLSLSFSVFSVAGALSKYLIF